MFLIFYLYKQYSDEHLCDLYILIILDYLLKIYSQKWNLWNKVHKHFKDF